MTFGSPSEIRGTLVTYIETTRKVIETSRLREERARLSSLFQQAPAFYAVLRGRRYIFEMTNPLYQALVSGRSVLGKSVLEAILEAEEQGFIALRDRVYESGEAIVGQGTRLQLARNETEILDERYFNFVHQPMREADGNISGIIVLGVDVTDSKRGEQASSEMRSWRQ